MSQTKSYNARVKDVVRYGDDKAVLRLVVDGGFSYQAGQYVLLSFAGMEARPYSIANAPGADSIEIHIKDNGRGGLSSYAIKSLARDEIVDVTGPYGECIYQKTDRNIILVGGGMGIAPLKAIAEEAVRQKHSGAIHLYWGAKTLDDIYMDAELQELAKIHEGFAFEHVSGQLVGEYVMEHESDLSDVEIYLSGPAEMISAIVLQMVNKGASLENIYTDQPVALKKIKI